MNETERRITQHLRHLADNAPHADLQDPARMTIPAHRSWATPALVAAAIVALVVVGTLSLPGGASDPPPATSTAHPGQRLIGRGEAVLEVPKDWPIIGDTCSEMPISDRVVIAESRGCAHTPAPGHVDIEITDAAPPSLGSGTLRRVAGMQIRQTETAAPDNESDRRVVLEVENSGATFVLTGPAGRVRAIAATINRVPNGYAVVPDTSYGGEGSDSPSAYQERVRSRFEEAGFKVTTRRNDAPASVSDYQQGTVARLGTRITLTFR